METRNGSPLYRCADTALVRAARYAGLPLPTWPDFTDDSPTQLAGWQRWLCEVWGLDAVAGTAVQT